MAIIWNSSTRNQPVRTKVKITANILDSYQCIQTRRAHNKLRNMLRKVVEGLVVLISCHFLPRPRAVCWTQRWTPTTSPFSQRRLWCGNPYQTMFSSLNRLMCVAADFAVRNTIRYHNTRQYTVKTKARKAHVYRVHGQTSGHYHARFLVGG